MKIAIVGYGKQGRSAFEYWQSDDNEITICDKDQSLEVPSGVSKKVGADYLKNLNEFDLIVRSPSIHPKDIIKSNTEDIKNKITSVTNEFFRVCPTKNIVAVTGTKGKGTTTALIAKMLEADGKNVHIGGNIGIPPLDMLKADIKPNDWVVLELANYQLIDMKYSPKIAVCLMVVPEHLDWHESFDEYTSAKKQLFAQQKPDDIAIYYSQSSQSKEVASAGEGKLIPYYQKPGADVENDEIKIDGQSICKTDEIKLLGKHNWQNICAATTAVWQVSQNIDGIRSVLTTFSGMEHRLELVRELNGVKYYDDSFGTTPETAKVAIEAFTSPKIVILGGRGKGVPFDSLGQVVNENNVKNVIAIGETGPEIAKILQTAGYGKIVEGEKTIDDIAVQAQELAEPGDVVLLSTACTSFDMFDNYADRGRKVQGGRKFSSFIGKMAKAKR